MGMLHEAETHSAMSPSVKATGLLWSRSVAQTTDGSGSSEMSL